MTSPKLSAGARFPECLVQNVHGEAVDISQPQGDAEWRMIVVYRGQHCPICKKYLNQLDGLLAKLAELKTDAVAVCADSPAQLQAFAEEMDISVPLYGGMNEALMQRLGVYISEPRNAQETDHDFPEPAVFVINDAGTVQIVELSNAPFARPDLDMLVNGIAFIRENDYPIRGTVSF